jgi:hypothetical protein
VVMLSLHRGTDQLLDNRVAAKMPQVIGHLTSNHDGPESLSDREPTYPKGSDDVLRIGGTLKPFPGPAHLRRHNGYELLVKDRGQTPELPNVLDERLGLVLYQQVDGMDARVDQVAGYEIHDPVADPEGYARLRTLFGKRVETRSLPARHDKGKNSDLIHHRNLLMGSGVVGRHSHETDPRGCLISRHDGNDRPNGKERPAIMLRELCHCGPARREGRPVAARIG